MKCDRERSFLQVIFEAWLVGALACLAPLQDAQAERVLDLQFWSAEASSVALGGLWEFHAQRLLEPAQRRPGSELLLEISQPWRDYKPLIPGSEPALDRGSYVLLVKGLRPRRQGYALNLRSGQSMTRLIVAPKYAPERALRVQTEGVFAVFPLLRNLGSPQLRLVFMPRALDEVWMIIVQRWQAVPEALGGIPRLE